MSDKNNCYHESERQLPDKTHRDCLSEWRLPDILLRVRTSGWNLPDKAHRYSLTIAELSDKNHRQFSRRTSTTARRQRITIFFVGQFSLQTPPFREILARMRSKDSSTTAGTATSAVRAPHFNPILVFRALSNPIRLKLLKLMAGGTPLSATEAASIMHRDIDIVLQHLRVMRNAGLLTWKQSERDGRFLLYSLKHEWLAEPNVLDFGFCRIDVSALPEYRISPRRS